MPSIVPWIVPWIERTAERRMAAPLITALKNYVADQGISAAEMRNRLGYPRRTVDRWFSGRRTLSRVYCKDIWPKLELLQAGETGWPEVVLIVPVPPSMDAGWLTLARRGPLMAGR